MVALLCRFAPLSATILILLTGCGTEGEPAPTLQAGILVVSGPVSGVAFETATRSGTTGPDGEFAYMSGETITFRLGGTELGSTTGQPLITPFDLAGVEPVTPERPGPYGRGLRDWRYDRESPMHQAVNVSVLLQTFDQDGDPGNGVTIPAEIAALFEGVSVGFHPPDVINESERGVTIFRRNRAFRSVLKAANNRGLFNGYRTPTEPAVALQAVYDHLELEPPGFVVVHERNTPPVQYVTPEVARSFDELGTLERVEQDTDGDGVYDAIITGQYDERGHLASTAYDTDADGIVDASGTIRRDYDREGDPTRIENTSEGFLHNRHSIETRTYDALGAVVKITLDSDGDGVLDHENLVTYDLDGNVVRASSDDDADGLVERMVMRTFTEGGLLVEQTVFFGPGTGTRSTYEYDATGRLTRNLSVDTSTGATTREEIREYDQTGNLIRLHWDRGPSSAVSTTETRGYDDANREIWRETYQGGSNRTDRETWQYDANGNVTRYVEDHANDGQSDRVVESAFDAQGQLTTRATREQSCASRDLVTTMERWRYDGRSRLIRHEAWLQGDEPYETDTWVYGEDGRLLRREGSHRLWGTWKYDYQNHVYVENLNPIGVDGVIVCEAGLLTEDTAALALTYTSERQLEPATWRHLLGSDTGPVTFDESLPLTSEAVAFSP